MGFLKQFCVISPLNKNVLLQCQSFSCGDADLDDFFCNDTDNYEQQLLGKSYCFRLDKQPEIIVGAFTLANSSIESRHLPNSRKKKLTENIPHEKHLFSYPAVLIGRLGVNKAFTKKGIGSELLDYIKALAVFPENWFGCRYLTVDAYNSEHTIKYYASNDFQPLFSTEKQEKEHIGCPDEKELKSRLMFFDLIRLFRN